MRPRALLLLAALLALAACRPPEPTARADAARTSADGLVVEIETDDAPRLGTTPVEVRLRDDGAPVGGARVEIHGDMTHAGMVPVVRDARELEPGRYRSDDFAFTMAGDWILTVEAELPDGRRATAERRLRVAAE